MNKTKNLLKDCQAMSLRCIQLSLRNPEMIIMSIMTPALLMVMFYYLFGSAMDASHFNTSYINYILAGILIITIGQSAATTSVVVCSDIQKGLLDRFSSLPVARSSFLVGHVVSALVRNIVATAIVFAFAFLLGFSPETNFVAWLGVIGVLFLFMLVMTWLCVLFGLLVKSPEAANSMMMFVQVFTYLSSGFVPTHTMPTALRLFCEHQPLTSIIETLRSLLFSGNVGDHFVTAMFWMAGLLILGYIFSLRLFKKRISS